MTRDGSVRHAVFKGLREPEITKSARRSPRKRLITDADLASHFDHQPHAAAVRQCRPDQARPRRLLRAGRRFHAAAHLRPPGVAGAQPDRQGRGRLLPAPPLLGHAQEHRELRRQGPTARPRPTSPSRTPRAIWRWRSSASSSSTPGAASAPTREARPHHLRPRPRRGHHLARSRTPPSWSKAPRGPGLTPFVKTSGGKGLHVVVPLKPKLDWKKTHAATGDIAARIAAAAPETFVTNMAKEKRKRRIFIDFHRNHRSATAVAPYSSGRGRNLPASTPVNWGDLRLHRRSGGFELFYFAGNS
jgi:bifunctional non-homologous end joining protein LigD